MAKRGALKRAKSRQAIQIAQARLAAVRLIRAGARRAEISFETSRNRGWVVTLTPGEDVGAYDYVQERYVDGPLARKTYSRRYWQRKTGTFYR